MLLALRTPAWTAKQLVTIDALSGGRLLLGVGVGGEFPEEFAAADVPIRQRGRRLDELLTVLPDLLQGRAVSHHGAALQLEIPAMQPSMPVAPPLFVGGRSDAALRRAARFGDAWLPMWITPEAIRQRAERLAELAHEQRRPRPSLALLIGVHVDDRMERSRAEAAAYLKGQYGMPLERVERWSALGEAERVAEHLAEYLAAGVSEFVLMPLSGDPLTQAQRLAAVRERLLAAHQIELAAGPQAGGDPA
jgi:alkanesulfonate monooxygenase SsuD/methylene tetrahydromethanopterin reductase-like flavin-dependent oxidoreductase (luciferase family)